MNKPNQKYTKVMFEDDITRNVCRWIKILYLYYDKRGDILYQCPITTICMRSVGRSTFLWVNFRTESANFRWYFLLMLVVQ